MFLRRVLACATLAVAAASGSVTARAAAYPDPPPDPTVPMNGGLYVAKGGVAEIHFAPGFMAKIKQLHAKLRYIAPWYPLPGGADTGFGMPVGSDRDTFTDPNRITYPGGLAITDYKGNTGAINGVWLRFAPGGFYAVPWVNGKRVEGEKYLLAFSVLEAFAKLKEHGGGFGPKGLSLYATSDLSQLIDSYAEVPAGTGATKPYVKPGEPVGVINVAWKDKANAQQAVKAAEQAAQTVQTEQGGQGGGQAGVDAQDAPSAGTAP